jgi:hypothetical protein
LDHAFDARVAGHVYAQPLYWRRSGSNDAVAVAAEDNVVQAFDAKARNCGDDLAVQSRVRCFYAEISISSRDGIWHFGKLP